MPLVDNILNSWMKSSRKSRLSLFFLSQKSATANGSDEMFEALQRIGQNDTQELWKMGSPSPRGDQGLVLLMELPVTNRSSVAPVDCKKDDKRDSALTKRICWIDSQLLLGPLIPKTLKMGVVPTCIVLTMK